MYITLQENGAEILEGIMHLDIRPSNIILSDDGIFKVMDFGIARNIRLTMTRLTGLYIKTGGTLPYMALEQISQISRSFGRVYERTDIYGMRATMYHLAWEGLKVSESLKSIIEKCMKKRKEESLESVDELKQVFGVKVSARGVIIETFEEINKKSNMAKGLYRAGEYEGALKEGEEIVNKYPCPTEVNELKKDIKIEIKLREADDYLRENRIKETEGFLKENKFDEAKETHQKWNYEPIYLENVKIL